MHRLPSCCQSNGSSLDAVTQLGVRGGGTRRRAALGGPNGLSRGWHCRSRALAEAFRGLDRRRLAPIVSCLRRRSASTTRVFRSIPVAVLTSSRVLVYRWFPSRICAVTQYWGSRACGICGRTEYCFPRVLVDLLTRILARIRPSLFAGLPSSGQPLCLAGMSSAIYRTTNRRPQPPRRRS